MPIQQSTHQGRSPTVLELILSVSAVVILIVIAADRVVGETSNREERIAQVTAQRLAAAFQAGKTAGIRTFHESEKGPRSSAADVVEAVAKGAFARRGAFEGNFFGLPGLPEDRYASALQYLEWDSGQRTLRVRSETAAP